MVKNLPAVQETWVQSLGQEYPLEKEMTTHSSVLAREIPCTEKPGGRWSIGSQIQTRWSTHAIQHSQALHRICASLCLTEIHSLTFPHTLGQEVRFISSLLFSYFLEIIISPSLHKPHAYLTFQLFGLLPFLIILLLCTPIIKDFTIALEFSSPL